MNYIFFDHNYNNRFYYENSIYKILKDAKSKYMIVNSIYDGKSKYMMQKYKSKYMIVNSIYDGKSNYIKDRH